MTKKQYQQLAAILENKCESSWCVIEIADFLESNFENFDRKRFMFVCGFNKPYTYDELLEIYFDSIEKTVNQSVIVIQG